jgi:hypothetical protein
MTFASILLGCVIASIPACGFNFFIAGTLKKLLLLNVFAWIGFWIGQIFATWKNISFLKVGPIILGIDLLFSFVFIGLGYWLTNFQPSPKKRKTH